MSVFLSPRSVADPRDWGDVLELWRVAQVERVSLAGAIAPSSLPMPLLASGCFQLTVHQGFPDDPDRPPLNPAASDEDYRRRSVARLEASLEFCARLGVPRASLDPGWAFEEAWLPGVPGRPTSRTRALDQFKRSLDRLATRAEQLGVLLALSQGDPGDRSQLLTESSELSRLLTDLQIPFLGVRLDLSRLGAWARERRALPADWLEDLAGSIVELAIAEPFQREWRLLVDEADPRHRLLKAHPAWSSLPLSLSLPGASFERLWAVQAELEVLMEAPLLGPALPA
jgi:hypothetical protein